MPAQCSSPARRRAVDISAEMARLTEQLAAAERAAEVGRKREGLAVADLTAALDCERARAVEMEAENARLAEVSGRASVPWPLVCPPCLLS